MKPKLKICSLNRTHTTPRQPTIYALFWHKNVQEMNEANFGKKFTFLTNDATNTEENSVIIKFLTLLL